MTMTEGLVIFVSLVIVTAVVMMITGVRKRRKDYEKNNKAIPYVCFGEKVFLKPSEIEQFERATRGEKRRALNAYKARIKRGQIIPVYEKGEIIGYIPNSKYNG